MTDEASRPGASDAMQRPPAQRGGAIRLVVLTKPDPIQIWMTNRLARLVPVAGVISETGRPFARRNRNRLRFLLRRRGIGGAIRRYADLVYFKLRQRIDDHEGTIERTLGPHGTFDRWDDGLDVREVETLSDRSAVETLRSLAPDLLFCNGASILKRPVIEIPRLGVINIHTGIVPEYRGPSPEFWALWNRDADGIGVTVHWLTEEIDAGEVILQKRTSVQPEDNEITLRCRNVIAGAELVAEAVRRIAEGRASSEPQDATRARSWPRRGWRQDLVMRRRLKRWKRTLRTATAPQPEKPTAGTDGRHPAPGIAPEGPGA